MTQARFKPMNPATEIDRPGIVKLSGASITKVVIICRGNKGFPDSTRPGPKGLSLYDLTAVKVWLAENDLKNMSFTQEERGRKPKSAAKPSTGVTSKDLSELKIGIKNKKFKRHGQKIHVHVPERWYHITLHPQITRFSHSADHRLTVSI